MKKSLEVSIACMAIYSPTPGFKGRTFKLCVLTTWDFNFCVRSSKLRGNCWKLGQLVSWCFEPSQPQRITSGLSTSFTLSASYSFTQVIIPQVMFFESVHIPRALNTGTCIRQGDLFYCAGLNRNHVLVTANTGEIGRGFGKKCR